MVLLIAVHCDGLSPGDRATHHGRIWDELKTHCGCWDPSLNGSQKTTATPLISYFLRYPSWAVQTQKRMSTSAYFVETMSLFSTVTRFFPFHTSTFLPILWKEPKLPQEWQCKGVMVMVWYLLSVYITHGIMFAMYRLCITLHSRS